MINYIWMIMIIISIIFAICTNNVEELTNIILSIPETTLGLFITIFLMLVFWNGILEIAKDSGLLSLLGKGIKKVIRPLFKDIPKDHVVMDYISFNLAANILGLGNAATPMGLKAMKELKGISKSDVASKEMITLLILNTSGLTLIPTTIIAIRKSHGAKMTVQLIPYIILMSLLTTAIAILIDYLFRRKK